MIVNDLMKSHLNNFMSHFHGVQLFDYGDGASSENLGQVEILGAYSNPWLG